MIQAIDPTNCETIISKEEFSLINQFHAVLCTNLTPATHTRDYLMEETTKTHRTYRFCPLKFDKMIKKFTLHEKYLKRASLIYQGKDDYPSSSKTYYYINRWWNRHVMMIIIVRPVYYDGYQKYRREVPWSVVFSYCFF